MEKASILSEMIRIAGERYGGEEAKRLRPFLERLAESINKVQEFELEPGDEPSIDTRED